MKQSLVNMVKCKVPTCTYDTEEDIDELSAMSEHLMLLGFHREDVHPKQPQATQHQPLPEQRRSTVLSSK